MFFNKELIRWAYHQTSPLFCEEETSLKGSSQNHTFQSLFVLDSACPSPESELDIRFKQDKSQEKVFLTKIRLFSLYDIHINTYCSSLQDRKTMFKF